MVTREHMLNTFGRAFADVLAASLPPQGVERYKLDRLLELRAMIASLRAEREDDPLLEACGVKTRSNR
jgi:hypothetical protein